jgi:hypothetical protein
MATINIHNYEAYLLDYLEGNLSEALCAELGLFAIKHPELEIDLEDQNLPVFNADQHLPDLQDDFKLHLKKTELNFPDEELLNYLDNNLTEAAQKVLEAKLLKDKELAADFVLYKKTLLSPDAASAYPGKTSLLKTEDEFFINNRLLAYFENTLTAAEKTQLELELKNNPKLEQELQLFSSTRLYPDAELVFPDKQTLKKEARVFVLFNFRTIAAMAAAILLIFVLAYVLNTDHSAVQFKKEFAGKELPVPNSSTVPAVLAKPEPALKNAGLAKNPGTEIKKTKGLRGPAVQAPAPEMNNSLAENKVIEQEQPVKEKELPIAEKELVAENRQPEKIDALPETHVWDPAEEKQMVMTLLEESDDDAEESSPSKNGFWKKAVKLAKRANSLGVKSIDGVERPHEGFALSLNAFSVERH